MFSSCTFFFLIIILKLSNPEEADENRSKKQIESRPVLPSCVRPVFDESFMEAFTQLATNFWTPAARKTKDNLILNIFHILRTTTLVMAGATGQTLAEFETDATKVKQAIWAEMYKRHFTCFMLQTRSNSTPNNTIEDHGHAGLVLYRLLNPVFTEKAFSNFGVNLSMHGPYVNRDLMLKSLNKAVTNMTNNKMKNYFDKIIKNDSSEVNLWAGHYFKLDWLFPFNDQDTEELGFVVNTATDRKVKVPMMRVQALFPRSATNFENKSYDWVEVPFKNPRFSMFVIVPRKNIRLKHIFIHMLRNKIKFMMMMNLRRPKNNVTLLLPKFTYDDKRIQIKKFFENKRVRLATLVSSNSDLNLMLREIPLEITEIYQNTYVKIDEKGLETAGVVDWQFNVKSGVELPPPPDNLPEIPEGIPNPTTTTARSILSLNEPLKDSNGKKKNPETSEVFDEKARPWGLNFVVNATRPFIYAIVDREAKIPLIYAKIIDPTYKS